MLSKQQNELLTRTDPGTPGGALLRRYWQPAALAEELPPGGPPLPIRLLGEDLLLIRNEQGRVGLLGRHCAHRGADLSYGRLEDGGLRCLYHGWLYDVAGNCLEQPGESAGSTFKERVHQAAYPCREAGGLIFAYLGPGEPPILPAYECLQVPEENRWATKIFNDCNYLQGNEGGIDPVHTSFLHRRGALKREWPTRAVENTDESPFTLYSTDIAPSIHVEETNFGLRIYALRQPTADETYRRLTAFIMPNASAFPGPTGAEGYGVNWHVPIDDTHHWRYILIFSRQTPLNKLWFINEMAEEATTGYRLIRNRENRYLQDRTEMRDGSFSGMGTYFQAHDLFAVESQGPILDRSTEHLGSTDKAIIAARQMMLHAIEDLQAGHDPIHVIRQPTDNEFGNLRVFADMIPGSQAWRV